MNDTWILTPEEQTQTLEVDTDFYVDFYDPEWKLLWVRFGGPAQWVNQGPVTFDFKTGQRVHIHGTYVGKVGLSGDKIQITQLPVHEDIPIVEIGENAPATLSLNGQRVRLRTVASGFTTVDPHHIRIDVAVAIPNAHANVIVTEGEPLPNLDGALIEVEGVADVQVDSTGKVVHWEVWAANTSQLKVLGYLSADPRFNAPITTIDQLSTLPNGARAHVSGVVHALNEDGAELILRDDTGQVSVQTWQVTPFAVGEHVELIGDLERGTVAPRLINSFLRLSRDGKGEGSSANAPDHFMLLRLTDQILTLSPEEAMRGYPVALKGVVTWANPHAPFFFVADASGSVRVEYDKKTQKAPSLADRVQLTGETQRGRFAPSVRLKTLDSSAQIPLLAPERASLQEAMTGVKENHLISLEGYVAHVNHNGAWGELECLTEGGPFLGIVPWDKTLGSYVGSVLEISGVASAVTNDLRELTGLKVYVADAASLVVRERRSADPFALPLRSIASLRRFSTSKQINRLVRVSGTVVYARTGDEVCIQDGSAALRIYTPDTVNFQPGDVVSAVGLPVRDGVNLTLQRSV
ncbi:MAG TPA: hypothetical protein VIM69_11920, partial [Opitutaceae bacterium]